MIIFHSITRKIKKTDSSSRVVLEMPYEDVNDLCHILWECRDKGILKDDNEKFLQLEFQNLRHLLVDGQTCEPFEICSLHEGLEQMGWGDEKQGFKEWHDIVSYPDDLPVGEDWVLAALQNEEGQTFDKPYVVKYCRPEWYLLENTNSAKVHEIKIGTDKFKYKVVKWRKI